MLRAGQTLEVAIEKPASGGRMIARHEGQVLLVAGAIPGERADVVVERVEKHVAFAAVTNLREASPDRRAPQMDPLCGGSVYAHIELARQRAIKSVIVADAFARIAKHPLSTDVDVAASPERGYRTRARLHVRDGRVGFYREGTHDLCDAAATAQLHERSLPTVEGLVAALRSAGRSVVSVELSETLAADQRACHVEIADGRGLSASTLEGLLSGDLQGVSVVDQRGSRLTAGLDRLSDPLTAITGGRAAGTLRRSTEAFFQANRFLLPALVTGVMESVLPSGAVLDLYSGVGLFAVALAGAGRREIVAVEGHATSGGDLRENAAAFGDAIAVVVSPVEGELERRRKLPPTVVVDPPRTGISKPVVAALVAGAPKRIVYVSCDPPTLARDARLLIDGGYGLVSIRAFDLFPNTPHIESLAVFDRR
jgi:23S rRNA (uracil1939-C5)-methyltransferase